MAKHRVGLPTDKANPECPECKGFGTVVRGSFVKACECVAVEQGSSAQSAPVRQLLDGLGVAR